MERVKDYKITVIPANTNYSDYICEGRVGTADKHGDILREYGILVYGDNSVFSLMDEDSSLVLVEYYLGLYGNVIFYNLSDDFGMLCVLGDINEKQRRALDRLFEQLSGYTVECNYFVNDNFDDDFYEPFEDSGDFSSIKFFLDSLTVKEKVKIRG